MSLSFHELIPVLHSSALILHPSVSQSVSDEPRYRAAIVAKKKILSYRPEIEKCNLCIGEKKEIILADENKTINRNDEILTNISFVCSAITRYESTN